MHLGENEPLNKVQVFTPPKKSEYLLYGHRCVRRGILYQRYNIRVLGITLLGFRALGYIPEDAPIEKASCIKENIFIHGKANTDFWVPRLLDYVQVFCTTVIVSGLPERSLSRSICSATALRKYADVLIAFLNYCEITIAFV